MPAIVQGVFLLLVLQPGAWATERSAAARADYEQLLDWRYTAEPVVVPPGGLSFGIDSATWQLDSGRVWLAEPLAGGEVSGLVFEGTGRFRMEVPDRFELAQLRRFALEPDLERLDESFNALVLRAPEVEALIGLPLPPGAAFSPHKLARERHDHWLRIRRHDADARVLAALLNAADRYLRADVRTNERGWLTYDYDARRLEEVHLEKFQTKNSFVERWLALQASGPAADDDAPRLDLEHVAVTADLTRLGREPRTGLAGLQPVLGEFETELRLRAVAGGERALQLYLYPLAEVTEVLDEAGRPLAFVRDRIGARSTGIDKRIHDDSLLVLLDRPTTLGERLTLRVRYELEVAGYAPGRDWYPSTETVEAGLEDRHTATLDLTCRERFAVRAMGEPGEETVERGLRRSRWTIDRPAKMVTFSLAAKPYEEDHALDGLPRLVAFGPLDGYMSPDRIARVGGDVAASLAYYRGLFGVPLPAATLYATLIPAAHGQAFDGFLHIGDLSAVRGRAGVMERFRAHEVAHEWWGHLVGWATYRDQWLSESLAEYSAMMFIEERLPRGDKLFREMLDVYADELKGSIKSRLSGFSRSRLPLLNRTAAARVGPIGHGYRCATADAPSAYLSQVYRKGALVLHMLRQLLRDDAGSDQPFRAVLRDFAHRHQNADPSTRDLQAAVERQAGGDWSWFFDQWIYRAEIPSYDWSHRVIPDPDHPGRYVLELEVRQSDVPPGFRMPVPILLTFPDGAEDTLTALVDQPVNTFRFPLGQRPSGVEFNPDRVVLAGAH